MFRQFSSRAGLPRGRAHGFIVADLLLASFLALSAAIITLQAISSLIRQSEAARNHRDGAYAFAALVEEVIAGSKDGAVEGHKGWRAEAELPGMANTFGAFSVVRVTGASEKGAPAFTWESWRESGR